MSVVLPSTSSVPKKTKDYTPAVRHKRATDARKSGGSRSRLAVGKSQSRGRKSNTDHPVSEDIIASRSSNSLSSTKDQSRSGEKQLLQKDTLYEYSTKHEICLDILCDGCVQSFVEFFYLTHRPSDSASSSDSAADANAATEGENVPGIRPSVNETAAQNASATRAESEGESFIDDVSAVPLSGLNKIAQHLRGAEAARRSGDAGGVFGSYVALGSYFDSLKDYDTATYFHKKCVLLAQETGDMEHEWEANNALGRDAEELGDLVQSIEYYDRCLSIAKQEEKEFDSEAEGSSNKNKQPILDRLETTHKHLVAAYKRFAEKCAANSDHQQAIQFFKKGLVAAQSIKDEAAEADSNYRLGVECEALNDTAQAVKYYSRYLSICQKAGDKEGEQTACSVLARAYSSQKDLDQSAKYLEKRRKLALRTDNSEAEAAACRDLGIIANQQHDFVSAAQLFSNAFDISQRISLPSSDIDRTRVGLGIARGNEKLNDYIEAALGCKSSVAFYDWKVNNDVYKQK